MLRRLLIPVFAVALAAPAIVHAQDNTERGRDRDRRQQDNDGGGGGDRRAEWRERMANFMKERLSATDDEWKVIQPKLEKVAAARRDSGGFGGGRGPGGRGGDDNETPTPAQQASRDLNTTLENKNATAEEIAAKLKALREARAKAKETLASAQKDLKEVLTQRQEAVLVEMGMLE